MALVQKNTHQDILLHAASGGELDPHVIKGEIELPTLGEKTRVRFGEDNQGMYCMPGSGSRIRISSEHIRATCERYSHLKGTGGKNSENTPLHQASGEYNTPNWENCPNDRSCPYIASLVDLMDKAGTF
jgi:hypothetical protein